MSCARDTWCTASESTCLGLTMAFPKGQVGQHTPSDSEQLNVSAVPRHQYAHVKTKMDVIYSGACTRRNQSSFAGLTSPDPEVLQDKVCKQGQYPTCCVEVVPLTRIWCIIALRVFLFLISLPISHSGSSQEGPRLPMTKVPSSAAT